jgi:uncharacterized cupin superfamily protein
MDIKIKKASEEEVRAAEGWGDWEKEPSEFPWNYDEKETCYIKEGRATVTPEGGVPVTFGPGDLVTFPDGAKCVWRIDETIKKKYRFGE